MCFGGHGYIREWGMEQYVRDTRIAQIYEGTNGIQANDLMGRKVVKNNGVFVASFVAEMREAAGRLQGQDALKASFLKAVDTLESLTQAVIARSAGAPDEVNAAAVDYLQAFGLVTYAYMFVLMAAEAAPKQDQDSFYANKLALANFYFQRVLPELDSRARAVEAGAQPIMQFAETYF
ncbi:MAG TPA: acyl-CoA dehydrogenase C-terminal domain-containing protein, partial [Moraxellaceae bacterium]|nr:acyl-CoA dehydrogenase C-terminal domain-containing protein [Moraxellaceae bacterium]